MQVLPIKQADQLFEAYPYTLKSINIRETNELTCLRKVCISLNQNVPSLKRHSQTIQGLHTPQKTLDTVTWPNNPHQLSITGNCILMCTCQKETRTRRLF